MYTTIDPFEYLFRSPFYQTQQRVVVISDTEMAELRQAEAKREILALESKANRYFTAAQELEARVQELREEHKLLEGSAEEDKKLAGTTK